MDSSVKKKSQPIKTGRSPKPHDLFLAGIGSSAGGIETLIALFENLDPIRNLSIIVVQHFSDKQQSQLSHILSKKSKLPVRVIKSGMLVKSGNVYIAPPKAMVSLDSGKFSVFKPKSKSISYPVDHLFQSLAESYGYRSIGIVLSGSGSDGASGIQKIKEHNGLVIVQDPSEAKFDGMPSSAVSTGVADFIIPVSRINIELSDYIEHSTSLEARNELQEDRLFNQIIKLVKQHASFDFSEYKTATLRRRTSRRMAISKIKSLEEYIKYLKTNRNEILLLTQDFFIGVTCFFRDPKAFIALRKKVIPELFKENREGPIKVWVVGVSTGEEAYTLAMLFREFMDENSIEKEVKVFATDVDEKALAIAGKAVYPRSIEKYLSEDRLQKFFIKYDTYYKVRSEIRSMVYFSYHNIFQDPPFYRLDLITCRNLLIYLQPTLQEKVFSRMHFALNLGGYLFLGTNETAAPLSGTLKTVDKKWNIYRNIKLSRSIGGPFVIHNKPERGADFNRPSVQKILSENKLSSLINKTTLEYFGYACIHIDQSYRIINAYGEFQKYLNFPEKQFSINLLKIIPKELSSAIGSSVRNALKTGKKVILKNVSFVRGKVTRTVNILTQPIPPVEGESKRNLLVFLFGEEIKPLPKENVQEYDRDLSNNKRIRYLEEELFHTREHLQATVEELGTSNEELQSSNEELLAANEELQSTNEEFQSVNEELQTVNTELQEKIRELGELNDDMDNLLKSTNIGTLFLDSRMHIRKFTPAVKEQFNLIASDIGRPITHISSNLKNSVDLVKSIKSVIKNYSPLEKEVQTKKNQWFLMRILPYITKEKAVDGAVVTFVNINEQKKVNSKLEKTNRLLQTEIEERERLEKTQQLLLKINADVNESKTLNSGMKVLVSSICKFYNLDLGLVWLPDKETKGVISGKNHYANSPSGKGYLQSSNQVYFKRNQGLVGRVYNSGKPELIPDISKANDTKFVRKNLALEHGIKVVMALPILSGNKVEGVITFYKSSTIKKGQELLDLIMANLSHLSGLIRKQRDQEQLKKTNKELYRLTKTLHQKTIALKEAEQKWNSLVTNASQNIIILNKNFEITFLNRVPTVDKQIGHTKGSMAGNNWVAMLPKDQQKPQQKLLENVIRTGKPVTNEIRGTAGNHYRVSYTPHIINKQTVGIIILADDISEMKHLEQEIKDKNSELERQNREMEEFTYFASHDLKAPVSNMQSLLQIWKEEMSLEEDQEKIFDRIKDSADRMHQTIKTLNDILAFKKSLNATRSKLDLNKVLEEVLADLNDQIEKNDVKIEADFKAADKVYYPPVHLRSIFQNLISNAIKYRHKRRKPVIRIKSFIEKGYLGLTIQDNGIGIDLKRHKNKMFGLFKRFNTEVEGKGIGLHIVKTIINTFRGKIEVESEPGKGTSFKIYLHDAEDIK